MHVPADPLFRMALVVSACFHITLVTGWSHHSILRLESYLRESPALPAVIYVGEQTESVSHANQKTSVSLPPPSSAEVSSEAAIFTKESQAQDRSKSDLIEKSGVIETVSVEKFDAVQDESSRHKGSRRARVEHIDLSDAQVLRAFSSYYKLISSRIDQRIRYPANVVKESKEGMVYISFVLHRDGGISDVAVVEKSKDPRLDKAAFDGIWQSIPFPPFPSEVKEKKVTLYLPISFELKS